MYKKHRSMPLYRGNASKSQVAEGAAEKKKVGSSYDSLHRKNPYFQRPPDFYKLYKQHKAFFEGVPVEVVSQTNKPDAEKSAASTERETERASEAGLFLDHAHRRCHVNWKSLPAVRALTRAMLQSDFSLTVQFPAHYLVPPLPNRLNYLCWLADLHESCASALLPVEAAQCTVLDVGTGASAIYPLLGRAVFGMRFLGSDINTEALAHAQENLRLNPSVNDGIRLLEVPSSEGLQTCIASSACVQSAKDSESSEHNKSIEQCMAEWISSAHYSLQSLRGPIRHAFAALCDETLSLRVLDCEHAWQSENALSDSSNKRREAENERDTHRSKRRANDESESDAMEIDEDQGSGNIAEKKQWKPLLFATMTNPPFYDLEEQIQENEETVCSGNTVEMKTIGGESIFIAGMIADSLVLRESVLWYTAMVGKKSSLSLLKQLLLQSGIPRSQIFVQEFAQGVTYRWGLAWTFSAEAAALYAKFTLLHAQSGVQKQAVATKLQPLLVISGYKDFTKSMLHEELSVLQSSLSLLVSTNASSSSPVIAEGDLPLSLLFPAVEQRTQRVFSDLEKAVQGLNLQTHIAELSFLSPSQGSFQSTAVQGQLHVRPIDRVTEAESCSIRLRFGVHFQQGSSEKHLTTVEVFTRIMQLDRDGEVEIRTDVKVDDVECSEGLASRIQHRVKEHWESEFVRSNRRWRRLLNPKSSS